MLGAMGSGAPSVHRGNAGDGGQWVVFSTRPHCKRAVGSGVFSTLPHCMGLWAVGILECSAALQGAVGNRYPLVHDALHGEGAVGMLQYTAALLGVAGSKGPSSRRRTAGDTGGGGGRQCHQHAVARAGARAPPPHGTHSHHKKAEQWGPAATHDTHSAPIYLYLWVDIPALPSSNSAFGTTRHTAVTTPGTTRKHTMHHTMLCHATPRHATPRHATPHHTTSKATWSRQPRHHDGVGGELGVQKYAAVHVVLAVRRLPGDETAHVGVQGVVHTWLDAHVGLRVAQV